MLILVVGLVNVIIVICVVDGGKAVVGADQHVRRGLDDELVERPSHQPSLVGRAPGGVQDDGVRVGDRAGRGRVGGRWRGRASRVGVNLAAGQRVAVVVEELRSSASEG